MKQFLINLLKVHKDKMYHFFCSLLAILISPWLAVATADGKYHDQSMGGGGSMTKSKQFCINLISVIKTKLMEHSDKVLHFATHSIVLTLATHWEA